MVPVSLAIEDSQVPLAFEGKLAYLAPLVPLEIQVSFVQSSEIFYFKPF